MTTTKEAKDIAKARADEAEAVAAAYAIQLAKREQDLDRVPTPTNYQRLLECKAQLAAARRHYKHAEREYKQCR